MTHIITSFACETRVAWMFARLSVLCPGNRKRIGRGIISIPTPASIVAPAFPNAPSKRSSQKMRSHLLTMPRVVNLSAKGETGHYEGTNHHGGAVVLIVFVSSMLGRLSI